jgi:glucokinase
LQATWVALNAILRFLRKRTVNWNSSFENALPARNSRNSISSFESFPAALRPTLAMRKSRQRDLASLGRSLLTAATNLPWIVDAKVLAQEVGVQSVVLLNDLGATGHSLEHLPPEDFCVLNKGTAVPGASRALLAAGTGLGEGILFWIGDRYKVVPSEGGHSDYSPRTDQQIELLKFMRHRHSQVSWELILSGRGFRTLHEFIAPSVKHPIFEDPDADPAPFITHSGLEHSCPVCVETLDLWTSIYGAEAGNLALKVLALGGVYVAGGIAVKILPKMKDGTFFNSFRDKWHFEAMLSDVPLSIVLNESAPLIGAAYEAYATVK